MSRPVICLVAPPYSGHLHPIIGLGRELASVAFVTVVSTPGAAATVESAGLRFHPILADREEIITGIASPGHAVKNNPLRLYRQLRANAGLQVEARAALDDAFAQLKPDLVIADFTLPVAGAAATGSGARWWTLTPSPCVFETPDGPPAYFGGLLPADHGAAAAGHAILRRATRGFKRVMFFMFRNAFRQAGLPSVYRQDGSERVYSNQAVLAIGVPELEFPRSYPECFQFIGSPGYTPPSTTAPPVFIPGKPHILITLGTHLAHRKNRHAAIMREIAASQPDWVFHFSDGSDHQAQAEQDGNFHRYPFISYAEHLSRYELVVHHGGSGVALHCLARGIPSVVIPLDFDQFDYAARLSAARVSLWAMQERELAPLIRLAMTDHVMRDRCREFAEFMKSRDAGKIVRQLLAETFSGQ